MYYITLNYNTEQLVLSNVPISWKLKISFRSFGKYATISKASSA